MTPGLTFCTSAMGRAMDVQNNLVRSMTANPGAKFVLLNYSSLDHLDRWAKQALPLYIERGQLTYAIYWGAEYWQPSHARNVAAHLVETRLMCNLDADNFAPAGFDGWLLSQYSTGQKLLVSRKADSSYGRIAIDTELFRSLGGYNEAMTGYGWEDVDLEERALASGIKAAVIPAEFLVCTEQSRAIKTENYPPKDCNLQQSNDRNQEISRENLARKDLVANRRLAPGAGIVQVNWSGFKVFAGF